MEQWNECQTTEDVLRGQDFLRGQEMQDNMLALAAV